ncbi:MAG: MotA/TolQ/ExbB proton channel family protein [Halanaerobium sp.]|nr:MotA/TolQ/ExbB proton channel family protein [Halanaerobium sp.]
MKEILLQGGPMMIPLIICSVIAVGTILERFFYLRRVNQIDQKILDQVEMSLLRGETTNAVRLLKGRKDPVARIFSAGLASASKNLQEIENKIRVAGEEEIKNMEKNLSILDVIATVAPLIGLLGTVLGIIDSFNILAAMRGMAAPQQLSSGIAEALITTATGLVIAIPCMLIYSYFTSRVDKAAHEMNKWTVHLISILKERGGENV